MSGRANTPVLLPQDVKISLDSLLLWRKLCPVVLDCIFHQLLMAVKGAEAHAPALLCSLRGG